MYGIGIIGCGAIAERRHAPEYAADATCRIVGFYDSRAERAEKLAAEYGARAFGSMEELLDDPQIDAVSVCTANSTHAEISIKALQAGKHVLCEKPLATCSKDVRRMIAAAEKAGRVLMVAQNQRMDPAHRVAKRLLEQGEMGRVLSLSNPPFLTTDQRDGLVKSRVPASGSSMLDRPVLVCWETWVSISWT